MMSVMVCVWQAWLTVESECVGMHVRRNERERARDGRDRDS